MDGTEPRYQDKKRYNRVNYEHFKIEAQEAAMKKAHYFTMLIAFFLLLAVNACSNATPANLAIEEHITPTPIDTIERYSSSVQIVASSFQELVYYSDMIVVGQVVSKEQIINTARDPGDLTQPDPQLFGITQFYSVTVESVLKGEPVTSLLVGQHQGYLEITSDTGPTSAEIEAEITRNEQITFTPLSLNTRYLFFLRIAAVEGDDLDGYESTDLYAGVLEPWRFRITSDEFLIPETHLWGTNSCVLQETLQNIDVIIIDVSDGAYTPDNNICIDPYPPPATNFPELPGGLTPYP